MRVALSMECRRARGVGDPSVGRRSADATPGPPRGPSSSSLADVVPADVQPLQAAQEEHRLPTRLVGHQRQTRASPEQGGKGELCLEPRKRRSEAEVDAKAEAQVSIRSTADIEAVRLVEVARVAIG